MSIFYQTATRGLLILLSTVFLFSCYSGKKAQANKLISESNEVILKETQRIAEIDVAKDRKLAEENIDTTINNRIMAKLAKYKAELDTIKSKTSLVEYKILKGSRFRRYYKNGGQADFAVIDSLVNKSDARLTRYSMIKDGIAQSEKRLFEMAAFFGPGIFNIPDAKLTLANERFIPIVDSLISFANSYASIEQTGTLVVNGYADGMDINDSSELFSLLLTELKKTSANKEALNHKLSELRARSIANLMNKLVLNKQDKFLSWDTFNINLFEYGQGETYPSKTIKDYTTDDERRRVVLIYWSVLPKD